MSENVSEMESIEASILRNISTVARGNKLLSDLVVSVESARSKLRNLISAYRAQTSQEEIDSLIYAIIYDNALTQRDILFVFDMCEEDYIACTKRLNDRRRPS